MGKLSLGTGKVLEPSNQMTPGQTASPSSHRPCGNRDGGELSPAGVCLEGLHLCPSSEPWEGTGPEQTQPARPEETSQGSPGPAEAEEAEEQVMVVSLRVWAVSVSVACSPVGLMGPAQREAAVGGPHIFRGWWGWVTRQGQPCTQNPRTRACRGSRGPEVQAGERVAPSGPRWGRSGAKGVVV